MPPKLTPFELSDREINLVIALRERYRFGEVTLIMRDGVIQRLKRVETFDALDAPSHECATIEP